MAAMGSIAPAAPRRVVVITGALSGIGRAAAISFAADGWCVVASGRRDEVGAALVAEISSKGVLGGSGLAADAR
jgi:NAD(P)-dependent dehydrogenase (short-subunit alcohol dehydrogenase family)